jgi:hypothetical protein
MTEKLEIPNFKFQMKNYPECAFFIFHLKFEILNF